MSDSGVVHDLLDYVGQSPSPFHAVASTVRALERHGYLALDETDSWELEPGTRAYVVRGGASLLAFELGTAPLAEAGCDIIGAHTDSPNLRLKPNADGTHHGYKQLGVEVYGGVLLSTWLDRDLGLAGRVYWGKTGDPPKSTLVRIDRPVARVPNLAIHLNRGVNSDGLKLNAQRHLPPVIGLASTDAATVADELASMIAAQHATSEVRAEDIHGWDLSLFDLQPPSLGGMGQEFIFAARLDNLASCFAATQALGDATTPRARSRMIVLYDHEEVGSRSAQGATSSLLEGTLSRLALANGGHDALQRTIARSFLVSADMAHAVHPNYADMHDGMHKPLLGAGPVIKTNVSQAYATDAESMARFKSLCRAAQVEPQDFVSRADLACGSTIGPITAARLGLRTVDVGNPLLSMHSIREMASSADVASFQRVLSALFA